MQIKARQFRWYAGRTEAIGNVFVSPSTCLPAGTPGAGNEGVRGLTFSQCMDVCLTIPQCRVVAFYPKWFGGPSACFGMDQTQVAALEGPTSDQPVFTSDNNYVGYLY